MSLTVFFGDIGTGKSTIAREVAKRLGFEFINFDSWVWTVTSKVAIYTEDDLFLLTPEETKEVYDSMHQEAKRLLQSGVGVVLESMYFKAQREEVIAIAQNSGVEPLLIEVVCDQDVIRERLQTRKRIDSQTPGQNLCKLYAGKLGEEERPHLILDTTNKSVDDAVKEVLRYLDNSRL